MMEKIDLLLTNCIYHDAFDLQASWIYHTRDINASISIFPYSGINVWILISNIFIYELTLTINIYCL